MTLSRLTRFFIGILIVVIGEAFILSLPFPPLQTVHETFASYGFPTISRHYGDRL